MKIFSLKTYFVFLSRNKMYTAINIGGLAVSLTLVIIIGLYVQHETSLDLWQKNTGNIYVLGSVTADGSKLDGSHWYIQRKLRSRYPEIANTCAIRHTAASLLQSEAGTKVRADVMFADKSFFSMFDYPLEEGDRTKVLADKYSIVLNRGVARSLFGDSNPVGKTVLYINGDTVRLHVTGIMDEMRNTALSRSTAVIPFEVLSQAWNGWTSESMNNASDANILIQTKPGTDISAKTNDMLAYFKTFFWFFKMPNCGVGVRLFPLRDIHFTEIDYAAGGIEYGDKRLVNIMLGAGLAVLVFSLMNYINLTVAQGGFRAREMAMRRLMGSRRSQVIARLIGESFSLCLLSLIIAMLLMAALLPAADSLLEVNMHFTDLFTPLNLGLIVTALAVFSMAAGVVPAIIISSAKPIDVVRGTFRQRTKMLFSKLFIVIQNVITIVMMAATLTMLLQVRHLINAQLGYDTDRLITFHNEANDSAQSATFIQELKKLPCVEQVSAGFGIPLNRGLNESMEFNGKVIGFQVFVEDESFMKLLGLELLRDNHTTSPAAPWCGWTSEGKTYVNRQALQAEGLGLDATHMEYQGRQIPVDGVLKDFHIGTITTDNSPVIIRIQRNVNNIWNYTVRYAGDPVQAFNTINALHKKMFDVDIDTTDPVFVDQQISKFYESNIRTLHLVSIFTVVAIVISLLGLVAMSTYFIEQRKREIAVRRVFGGSTKDILSRLVRTFLVYVLVAFVIAAPIIYWFMSKWLADFSYRISLSPLIFLAAGAVSLLISFVAVYFQSRQAANANPAETIKDNG